MIPHFAKFMLLGRRLLGHGLIVIRQVMGLIVDMEPLGF